MALTTTPMHTIRLRTTCPQQLMTRYGTPTEFGVQDREHHLHAGRITANGLIAFAISVSVVRHPADGSVRYRGPFVHGSPAEPFLYLSLRPVGGEPTAWLRRIKVRFPVLTWEQVEALPDSCVLSSYVSGERSHTVPLHMYEWTREDESGAQGD